MVGVQVLGLEVLGTQGTIVVQSELLRLWTHDTFGEDLIFNIKDGPIFYWDASGGASQRGIYLKDLTNAADSPIVAKQVMVSDVDRHVIAFGCNPVGSNIQDPY